MTSFKVVSLMAIVPDRECKTPTLIVSPAANAYCGRPTVAKTAPIATADFKNPRLFMIALS
jgi:hypothetical protein